MNKLILMLHGIGDNIMATAAIRTLKKETPNDNIYIGGFDYLPSKDVWENNPNVEGYIQFPIDFHPTYWNQDVFKIEMIKIQQIVNDTLKELKLQFDKIWLVTMQNFKQLHRIQRIGRELGIYVWDKRIEIFPTEKEIDFVKDTFKDIDYFVIHRGAGNYKKSWNIEECEETIKTIQEMTGLTPFIINNPKEDKEEGKELIIDGAIYLTDLNKKSIGITREIIRKSKFFIGTDSTPMHLASETNTPCVALFTMTNIHETSPLSNNSIVIVTNNGYYNCPSNIIEERYNKILVREYLQDYRKVGVKRILQALKLLEVLK